MKYYEPISLNGSSLLFLFCLTIVTILLLLIYSFFGFTQSTYANSPSFVKQEILNAHHGWQFWKDPSQFSSVTLHDGNRISIENAKNESQCNTSSIPNFVLPTISSTSYLSDGAFFNGTLWLKNPFEEPPLFDSIDIYPGYVQILIFNTTEKKFESDIDLETYVDEKIGSIYDPFINFTIIQNKTALKVSGNDAYSLVYSAINENGINIQNKTIWTAKNSKLYEITYSAKKERYPDFAQSVQPIISSFKIGDDNNNENTNNKLIQGDRGKNFWFRGLGMEISYPIEWKEEVTGEANIKTFKLRAPFSDAKSQNPSLHKVKLGMAIAIDSHQHPSVSDYRIEYSREPELTGNSGKHFIKSWQWEKRFFEVSAEDRMRVLETDKNYTSFYDKENPYHIFFTVDLKKMNYPEQYRAVFYIIEYLVINHTMCRLVDTTPWMIIPPPEFSISTLTGSNSLLLKPGDEREIEVTLKGSTHLPSEAVLSSSNLNDKEKMNYKQNAIQTIFTPNRTYIDPAGTDVSILHIKVLESASSANPYTVTLPISANISFPTTITNRAGEIFNNSQSSSLIQSSNLTLTIMPPLTLGDKFNDFIDSWITPISGLWTFIAGVAAVMAPLLIRLYKRKHA